jgi:hypothetical protein
MVPQGTTEISVPEATTPSIISSDDNIQKVWEEATEDERKAGLLLCEFQDRLTESDVLARFDFADRWNAVFPKGNKKLYERGQEAIKTGAKIAGMAESTVYITLRTTSFYQRNGYLALNKKAKENHGEIPWYHIRTIVDRLSDNKEARLIVEREIVSRRMSVRELEKLIDEVAPESKRKKQGATLAKEMDVTQQLISMVGSFKKLSHARGRFEQVLEDLNENFEDSPEHAKTVLEQTSALICFFAEIRDFMDEEEKFVTQMRDAAQKRIDGKSGKKAVKNAAENIQKQIAVEKAERQKKESAKAAAMNARGDADNVEIADDAPELDYGPELDDETTDPTDEQLSEIADEFDDDIQVDDDDKKDIFDELGEITHR